MTIEELANDYYLIEKEMCFKEPYYGMLLGNMAKHFNKLKNCSSCAVYLNGADPCLHIDSKFWTEVTNQYGSKEKISILKHEMLHLCFFHFDIGREMMMTNQKFFNIAADLSVNCYLPDIPKELEVDVIDNNGVTKREKIQFIDWNTWKKKLNLEPYKDIKYYWDKLNENKDLVEQMCNGNGSQHDFGGTDSGQSSTPNQTTSTLARKQMEHIMKQVADEVSRQAGKIPGELEDIISSFDELEPEKFNWKNYLRIFCSRSVNFFYRKTKRKKSKRFEGNEGIKKKHYCRVAVLPDTSGSVSDEELHEFINEFFHIKKNHAEVTITCFDTKVYEPFKLKRGWDIPISGRGGTDFKAAVDWCFENKNDYDCFIILTDGYDTVPDYLPSNLLWVLSSKTDLEPDSEQFENTHCIKLN